MRTIDWNVTARLGATYVKRYLEERELTVMFVVDRSASGGFGSLRRTKGDLATEVFAVLALAAARNNDRVGSLLFTDRVERHVAAAKGRRHALRVISDLLSLEPAGKGTDLAAALSELEPTLRRRAVVFVLSDLEDLTSPEVAEILGIPEATVRTRLFYARKEVATLLRGHKGFIDVAGLQR